MCVYIYIHIHSYFSTLNFPAFIFLRPSVFFKDMFFRVTYSLRVVA